MKKTTEDIVKEIYEAGGYRDLLKAIALLEAETYKHHNSQGDDPLDGDITEEIAEELKQDYLAELNELEGNI